MFLHLSMIEVHKGIDKENQIHYGCSNQGEISPFERATWRLDVWIYDQQNAAADKFMKHIPCGQPYGCDIMIQHRKKVSWMKIGRDQEYLREDKY